MHAADPDTEYAPVEHNPVIEVNPEASQKLPAGHKEQFD